MDNRPLRLFVCDKESPEGSAAGKRVFADETEMSGPDTTKTEVPLRMLCVGSPLLDIAAQCSPDVLERYHLKADDCILEKQGQAALFHWLLQHPDSHLNAGGSAQNTARIAKWVLRDRGHVAFAGCVGQDDFATAMAERLRSEGVEALYAPLSGHPTGTCACLLLSGADRSMIARLGAAKHLSARHLSEEPIRGSAEAADCVFVEGYLLAHSAGVVFALADACPAGQVFSLSLSAEYVCRDHASAVLRVLPRVDVLLGNEIEARTLAESLGLGVDLSVEETALLLANKDRPASCRPRIVVVTRGPRPVVVARGSEAARHVAVPGGVQVADSVGCGDALAGGFLAAYLLTGDVSEAAETGVLAAVEIAQMPGCNPPTHKTLFPRHGDSLSRPE